MRAIFFPGPFAVLACVATATGAPAALDVTTAERSIVAWAAGYDYEFDEIESDGASTSVPDGPFVAAPSVDLDDYYGLDVAEGAASIDSAVSAGLVRCTITATGNVPGAGIFQADGGGEGALHVTFALAEPTRVSFAADGRTNAGSVLANVSLRPAAGGAAIASGSLQAQTQFETAFAGILPAGTYVLDADLQAWAFGGGANADHADGELDVELRAYARADVDMDGSVGFGDLSAMLAAWGACPGCPADLDLDGSIGFGDLTVLLAEWGATS